MLGTKTELFLSPWSQLINKRLVSISTSKLMVANLTVSSVMPNTSVPQLDWVATTEIIVHSKKLLSMDGLVPNPVDVVLPPLHPRYKSIDANNNSLVDIVNITINIINAKHRLEAPQNTSSSSVTGTNIPLSNSTPVPWCYDLQGSDFIYTPTIYSDAVRHVIAIVFILLIATTIVGNAIVIVIVITDRPLRRITSSLVVSMATVDILTALCGELQSVIMILSKEAWAVSDLTCEIFISADLYFSLCGLLHITCLAGDRYLSIRYPFMYERYGHRCLVAYIVISWTLPVAFSFLPILLHWHRQGLEELYSCLRQLDVHVCTIFPNKGFSTASFLAMFALPTVLMCYCYAQIYRVSAAQRRRMRSLKVGAYSESMEPRTEQLLQLTPVANGSHGCTVSDNGVEPVNCEDCYIGSTSFIEVELPCRVHEMQPNPGPDVGVDVHKDDAPATNVQDSTNNRHSLTIWTERESRSGSDPTPASANLVVRPQPSRRQEPVTKHKHPRAVKKRPSGGFLGEEFRAARSIAIVFVCYTLTWSPYWIILLLMPYVGPRRVPDAAIGASIVLAYFGSALNPFVYYFSNTAVKKGITRLIRKILHRHGHHNHFKNISYC